MGSIQLRLRIRADALEKALAGHETAIITVTTRLHLAVGGQYNVKLDTDGQVRALGRVEAVGIKPSAVHGGAVTVGLRLIQAWQAGNATSPGASLLGGTILPGEGTPRTPAPVTRPRSLAPDARKTSPAPAAGRAAAPSASPARARAQIPARTGTENPANRRIEPRIDLAVEVGLESDNSFYTGLTQDISKAGLFVATRDVRSVGERITVQFTLPGHDQPIAAETEVRWVRDDRGGSDMPEGMGLRFLSLTPQIQRAIAEFLKTNESLFYDDE